MTLTDRLSGTSTAGADAAFDVFIDWAGERGFALYAAQEEAVLALAGGAHVVLATPTGSGKSLVAVAAHALALAEGRRSWYTAPIKALVSEKFFALVEIFGAERVGMLTGDAAVNPGAPIICATAEVLANHALRDRELADIGLVVMDEFHFYTEPDRGWAWQVPLLLMPDTQFLLMSATLGETAVFEEDLTRRTGRETVAITGAERPVPLEFSWVLTAVHETIELLLRDDRGPIYVVSFTQASAVEQAQALTSVELVSSARKAAIKDAVGGFRFGKGFGVDAAPAGAARGRGAPRGDAAEVPAAGRDPRPGRPARRHLRHRHPRRRHQRADPHRAAHLPDEVRRAQAAGAAGPGVPPDRRPRRAGRLRHHRLRRGAGARARRPQREGPGQGRRGPEEAPQGGAQEASGGHPDLHRGDLRPPRRAPPRSR